jgi:hypothetical protein
MRLSALPDDDRNVSTALQARTRMKKTGPAAGFFVCVERSAFFCDGQFRIDQPLLSRCAFDSRFISGSTATAIMVQTSAAMPSLLNRLV